MEKTIHFCLNGKISETLKIYLNKTGLQPVSRPVELVHYSEGWGVGAKSTLRKAFLAGKNVHFANAQYES